MRLGKKTLPAVSCIFSVVLHVIACVFSLLSVGGTLTGSSIFDKRAQAFVLICLSLVLSFPLLFEKKGLSIAVIVMKAGTLIFICMAVGTKPAVFVYLLPALAAELACHFSSPVALPLCAAAVGGVIASLAPHYTDGVLLTGISTEVTVLTFFFSFMIAVFMCLLRGYDRRYSDCMIDTVRLENALLYVTETNLAWQNYSALLEERTMEKERQRISREIHDVIGYTMTNLLMIIQAAQHCEEKEQIEALLLKAQSHINQSVNEARLSLRRLRDRELYVVQGANLFLQLTKTFSEITGIRITIDFGNMGNHIEQSVEKVVYRMLQESMTNSFRHGRATVITVSFWSAGGWLTVRVLDNGTGSAGTHVTEGIGLQGMRERAEELGGRITAGPVTGGFVIMAYFPERGSDE